MKTAFSYWLTIGSLVLTGGVGLAEEPMGILHVKGNVYLLHGAGPNITLQVGDEVVLLVNAGPAEMSEKIRAQIRTLSNKPIGFIIDTNADLENTSGTENLAKGGFFMLSSAQQARAQASVVAHLGVLDRMTAENRPSALWPTDTYSTPEWHLYSNDEPLILSTPKPRIATPIRWCSSAAPMLSAPEISST